MFVSMDRELPKMINALVAHVGARVYSSKPDPQPPSYPLWRHEITVPEEKKAEFLREWDTMREPDPNHPGRFVMRREVFDEKEK